MTEMGGQDRLLSGHQLFVCTSYICTSTESTASRLLAAFGWDGAFLCWMNVAPSMIHALSTILRLLALL